MRKKLISTLLAIAMLTALLPTAFAADTVTRAEWISRLVETFSMTVEDDSNMPTTISAIYRKPIAITVTY